MVRTCRPSSSIHRGAWVEAAPEKPPLLPLRLCGSIHVVRRRSSRRAVPRLSRAPWMSCPRAPLRGTTETLRSQRRAVAALPRAVGSTFDRGWSRQLPAVGHGPDVPSQVFHPPRGTGRGSSSGSVSAASASPWCDPRRAPQAVSSRGSTSFCDPHNAAPPALSAKRGIFIAAAPPTDSAHSEALEEDAGASFRWRLPREA